MKNTEKPYRKMGGVCIVSSLERKQNSKYIKKPIVTLGAGQLLCRHMVPPHRPAMARGQPTPEVQGCRTRGL